MRTIHILYSATFALDDNAEIRASRIVHTIIRSNRRYAYEEAQQVLEDAVRLSPNSADRQQVLGETARNNGALDVAQSAFEKTIKISEHATNKRPGAYIALARVLSESDEPDIALKVMARTQEVFKDAGGAIAIQVAAVQSVLYQQTGKQEEAQAALEQSLRVLKPGGRLVVISYHSLEDRLVKNFMRSGNFSGQVEKDFFGRSQAPFDLVTRKAVTPSAEELDRNPRSRSAKLRAAVKR